MASVNGPPLLGDLQEALAEGLVNLIEVCRQAPEPPASALGLQALQDLHASREQRERQCRLLLLLAKWNRVYNLTAVRDLHDMVTRHLLDSLSIVPWLPDVAIGKAIGGPMDGPMDGSTDGLDVIDVGSGAGLPVLPLAMARSDLQYGSIESNRRKTRFQQQALIELGLRNVTLVERRVEQVMGQARIAAASCVVSRAFTAPEEFLSLASGLLAPRGRVLVMLGQPDRLPASLPGWRHHCVSLNTNNPAVQRHLAVCERRDAVQ